MSQLQHKFWLISLMRRHSFIDNVDNGQNGVWFLVYEQADTHYVCSHICSNENVVRHFFSGW